VPTRALSLARRNGCRTAVELHFRMAQWFRAQAPAFVPWQRVARRWKCDRATAYRLLEAWTAATRNPLPRVDLPAATGTTPTVSRSHQ
jgi:hypothetical protein